MRSISPSRNNATGAFSISSRLTALVTLEAEGGGFRLAGLDEFQLNNHNKQASASRGRRPKRAINNGVADLITGRALFMKMVRLPRMPKEEAIETLLITQKESIPFNLKEAFHDVWILNEGGCSPSMDALIVAVKNEDIDNHLSRFQGAPFRPASISIAPAAITALIGASKTIDTSSPALFLDLGENVIGLHIFKNGKLIFTREIPFGVGEIMESLLKANLPDGEIIIDGAGAVDIIKEGGAPVEEKWNSRPVPLPLAQNHILPPMEKIAREIRRTIEYFTHSREAEAVAKGYLVGCGAIIKGMGPYIAERIDIPCAPYNPLDDFLLAGPDIKEGKERIGPLIAIAVGLAIDNGERINLVRNWPTGLRISRLAISPGMALASVVFATLCLGLIWGWVGFYKPDARIDKTRAEVMALKSALGEPDYSKERLKAINGEIARLERELSIYPKNNATGYDWGGFFREISRLTPGKIALTRLNIDFPNDKGDRPGYGAITFEGIVKGANKEKLIAISELIYRLKRSPFFASAQIKGTSGKSVALGDDDFTQFEVNAILNRGSSMMALSPGGEKGQGS